MRKIFVLFLMASLIPISVLAQKKGVATVKVVSALTDNDAVHNGVLYSLPKTIIRVCVDAELVVRKAGPYYRYSQKYLNINDPVKEDEAFWTLSKVSLQSVGQPDEARVFKIFTDGYGSAPLVNLTEEGVLSGINGASLCLSNSLLMNDAAFVRPVVTFDGIPVSEEVLTKSSSAAMAEEAAFSIYKLRKKRTDLLGSESSKQTDQATLNEINRLEAALVSLFIGAEKRVVVTRYFDFIADQASPSNSVLFRFSAQGGVVDKMDLSGTPVYIDVKPVGTKQLNELPPHAKRNVELNGLRYVLPGKVVVKLTDRNVPLLEQEMMMAQFGQVASLPVELLQQKDIRIIICPSTGALVKIERVP